MLLIQVLITTEYVWGSSSEIMLTLYMILLCLDTWSSNYSPSTVPYHPPPSSNGAGVVFILIGDKEDKEKKIKDMKKITKWIVLKSVIERLLCNQTLCKILGIRR